MTTVRKAYEVTSFKALPDADGKTGRFEAIVSVFGNVDLQGDRVVKGAFKNHLAELREKGDPIPIIWSHDWGNPFAHIGWADPKDAAETDEGLKLVGYTDEEPFARQVYKLMKERRVKEFSFAYDVVEEKTARDRANELLELRIIEAGPTLKGANPETQLIGVKARLEDAARKNVYEPLSGSDEERRQAIASAVQEAFGSDDPNSRKWTHVVATFAERVVVAVEDGNEDPKYLEVPYELSDGGAVNLGESTEVEIDVQLRRAAASGASGGSKAGRVLSAKNQRKIESAADAVANAAEQLKGVLSSVQAEQDEAEAEEKVDRSAEAKPEDPPTEEDKGEERGAKDDDLLRIKAEIEALSV